MANVRTYKSMIAKSKPGQKFYLNAINSSYAMIDYTRELIRAGKIRPDQNELDKMIVKDAQHKFFNGECIAPEMIYEIL